MNAPNNVQIYREEVYNEIKKSNKQAHDVDIDAISALKPKQTVTSFDVMKKIQKHD